MSVASLAYRINADTSQLGRELRFAERRVQRFQKRAESNIRKLGKAFATMGGLAATALIATGREGIRLAADMDQAASQIGTTTEELSALKFAARENKVEFDTLQPRLERFSRQVSDAADGTGQLVDVVDDYNVELRESDGSTRSFNDILRDVADATVEAEDGFERARIAAAAFGSRGAADMIPLLMEGGDEIERLEEKARSLGLTISDETGVAAQQYQAEMRRLTDIHQALSISLATEVTPALSAFVSNLADASQGMQQNAQDVSGLQKAISGALQFVELLRGGIRILGAAAGTALAGVVMDFRIVMATARTTGLTMVRIARRVGRTFELMFEAIRNFARPEEFQAIMRRGMAEVRKVSMEGLQRIDEDGERWREGRIAGLEGLKGDVLDITRETHSNMLSIQNAGFADMEADIEQQDPFRPVAESAADAVDDVDEEFQRLQSFVDSLSAQARTPMEEFTDALMDLQMAFEAEIIDDAQFEKLEAHLIDLHDPFEEAGEVIHDVTDEVENLEEQISLSAQLGEKAVEDLASTFADVLFDPFDASVTDMVTSFADGLARMAIDAAAADIVGSLISPTGFSGGGPVQSFSTGGFVSGPGSGTSDSIPAWLSNGEYVIDAKTTSHFGADYFRSHQHAAGFASGGPVGSAPSGGGPINVAIFDNRQDLDEWARSRRGRTAIVDANDTGGAP